MNYPKDNQNHLITINATSFGVVRDLESDKHLEIRASIDDSVCGELQSDWHGSLQGESEKVINKK